MLLVAKPLQAVAATPYFSVQISLHAFRTAKKTKKRLGNVELKSMAHCSNCKSVSNVCWKTEDLLHCEGLFWLQAGPPMWSVQAPMARSHCRDITVNKLLIGAFISPDSLKMAFLFRMDGPLQAVSTQTRQHCIIRNK